MQFNISCGLSLSVGDNILSISADNLPFSALIMSHLNNVSSRLWSMFEYRFTQIASDDKIILFNPESYGKFVAIDHPLTY